MHAPKNVRRYSPIIDNISDEICVNYVDSSTLTRVNEAKVRLLLLGRCLRCAHAGCVDGLAIRACALGVGFWPFCSHSRVSFGLQKVCCELSRVLSLVLRHE